MAGSLHRPIAKISTDSMRSSRSGLTLIEMLIAVVLTLIVVFALVRVFQMLGDNVRDTKAILEMSGQLRTFLSQLQEDLDSRTVTVRSYADPEAAPGYFELIEGIATDRDVDGDGNFSPDNDGDNLLNGTLPVATFTQVDPMSRTDADFHSVTDSKGNTWNAMTTKGDRDDVLMFTIRTSGKPFSGQLIGNLVFNSAQNKWSYTWIPVNNPGATRHTIESQEAEVVWWSEPDARGNFHIYRRLLLVRPDIEIAVDPNTVLNPYDFVRDNDLSVRMVLSDPNDASTAVPRANSLVDLALRENRYAHLGQFAEGPNNFPFPLRLERLRSINQLAKSLVHPNRLSEYLSLADTLAFDVKAFDPMAPLQLAGGTLAVAPSDPAYNLVAGPTTLRGAYVDLNYAGDPINAAKSEFSAVPAPRSGWAKWNVGYPATPPMPIRGVYDTWPRSYERDGIRQNNSPLPIDRGTNGLDDDNQNGVDDSGEFETAPPYSADLRGIEVSVRVFEFNTRQVRQASIVADFTEGLGP